MKITVRIIFSVVLVLQSFNLFSQEGNGISAGVDLVNKYIWRGSDNGGHSAQIQPTVVGSWKNFEVGYWGSFGVTNGYSEYDLWAKYSVKQFSISVYDYNQPFDDENGNRHGGYFNIPLNSAGSFAEMTVAFDGGDKFPLCASYNRFFYNDDATYLEAGYRFNMLKIFQMDFTVGMTPSAGSYGPGAGIVNIGLKGGYDLKLSDKFKLPVFAAVINNPQAEKTFFVFGLTLSKN